MASRVRLALVCTDGARRRKIEAILLGAKLEVAADIDSKVTHVVLADADNMHGLPELTKESPNLPIIVLCAAAHPPRVEGATVIADCRDPVSLIARLRQVLDASPTPPRETPELIGDSPQMKAVREIIGLVAPSDTTVLITGETGCGKECAARMVHRLSSRRAKPLVALNCAAIPDTMLEGELFGYEKGAFTGALRAFPGKVKLADGGTLALDEVGDLSGTGQAKILRAIETREFYRLGGIAAERFDARIIAMTNAELGARVADGGFRKDLYYRLAVAQIHLPPLRERRDDIAPVAEHLLQRIAGRIGRAAFGFTADAIDALCSHDWPGNVRELGNVIELALLRSLDGVIRVDALPLGAAVNGTLSPARRSMSERERLAAALAAAGGNKSAAARSLQWSRMTLYRKLERHHLAAGGAVVTVPVTV